MSYTIIFVLFKEYIKGFSVLAIFEKYEFFVAAIFNTRSYQIVFISERGCYAYVNYGVSRVVPTSRYGLFVTFVYLRKVGFSAIKPKPTI